MDVYSLTTHMVAPFTGDINNVSTWQSDAAPERNPFDIASLLCQAWNDTIKAAYLDLLGADIVLEAISARRLGDLGGPTFTLREQESGTNIGGVIGDSAISCVISWIPAEALWQFGHEYIPGVPASAILSNEFDPAYLLAVGEYANLERVGLTAGAPVTTFKRVIWQRKLKLAKQIQGFEVKPKPASLSRRLTPYG